MKKPYQKPALAIIDGSKSSLASPGASMPLSTPKPVKDELAGIALRPRNFDPTFVINGPAKADGKPWFTIRNKASEDAAEVLIYDQIGKDWWSGEGVGAKDYVEALQKLDPTKQRNLKVRINSPGGNVYDGLAIDTYHQGWKGRIDTFNDGLAASIASVLLLSTANGGKVHAAEASSTMIHPPSTMAQGTVSDMQRAIAALEAADKNIRAVYRRKVPNKTDEELSALMDAETWFTGPEAKEFGFVDEVTNSPILSNSLKTFDLSSFKRVPEAFRKLQNSAAQGGGHSPLMNRAQIIARLKKLGITVDDNSTDEQLIAQLDAAIEAKANPTANPAAAPAVDATTAAALTILNEQVKEMKAARDAERTTRVTAEIDRHINERRLPAALRASYINRAMADETVLAEVAQLPQVIPAEPITNLEITGESPEDICKGIKNLSAPMRAFERGNAVEPIDMKSHAVRRSQEILKNLAKLRHAIQNAHTIDSDLKRSVIMTEGMDAFKRKLLPLGAFSTRYNNVPLLGTDKIQVPYFPNFTTASTDFVSGTGYTFGESSDVQAKEITINKRKFQSFKWESAWINRQPYFDTSRLFSKQVAQLGVDVWTDILSVITLANFGAAVKNMGPTGFITETIIELRTIAEQADWPSENRSLMVDSVYYENILKGQIKVNEAGSDAALRRAIAGRVADFDIYDSPRIPNNSEGLAGFIALASAIAAATSPVMPGPGVQKQLVKYDQVTDPDTGLTFEYRFWGDADLDVDKEVVECNYGYAVGEPAALKRITNL
jgi:ATP-dependent protease ClpP protease subunit